MTKNQKKVVLGHLGDFQYYVYPYDYPDTVFLGQYPTSIQIDSGCVNQIIRFYNIAKAFLEGNYFSEANSRKEANSRRHHVKKAYNYALNEQRSKKQASPE